MSRTLYRGKHLDYVERDGWEFVERRCSGVVCVVATTEGGELILIEQERTALGRRVIELPAGLVGDESELVGEDATVAVRRELLEETGFDAEAFEYLGEGPSSAGLTSEVIRFYACRNAARTSSGGGVGGEEIAVHLVPLGDARSWLGEKARGGMLVDPKIWAALWLRDGLGW